MPLDAPSPTANLKSPRRLKEQRLEALRTLRSTWLSRWQELSENIEPKRGAFYETSGSVQSRGQARDRKIRDTTGREALRILQNGMMSGATSPSRPWIRFAVRDDGLKQDPEVKLWLSETTKRVLHIFAASNAYQVMHNAYGDQGLFGTAGYLILEDFEDVVRFYPLVVGEFFIGLNDRLAVDTVYREVVMTVAMLVEQFGLDACSEHVKGLYRQGAVDQSIDVIHAIEPNRKRDLRKKDRTGMAFEECYFEKGRGEGFLLEKGYHEFPAVILRWDVSGTDAYGTGPGMDALPDQKQLHSQQIWKGKGIAKQVDPPLNAPASMKEGMAAVTGIPGGVNFVNSADVKGGVQPTYQPNLNLSDLKEDMAETRGSVKRAFYADLFMAISQMEGIQPRGSKEIEERKDEKLVQLGPVLERLHSEGLGPTVMRVYMLMERAGLIPPKPEALRGREPEIEFISILAVAQKAIATVGIERLLQLVGQIFEAFPEARTKIDILEVLDQYADFLGVDPKLIIPSDDAQATIDAQAKAAQQQKAMEAAPAMAKSASDLASADVGGGMNALQMMTGGQ